jgi:hypothetical protein
MPACTSRERIVCPQQPTQLRLLRARKENAQLGLNTSQPSKPIYQFAMRKMAMMMTRPTNP